MSNAHTHINRLVLAVMIAVMGMASPAGAMPPAPPNDEVATAQVIGPAVPLRVYGSSVRGNNSINTTGGQIAAIDAYMDGPDVFYSFTPSATQSYRVMLLPWQKAPLRSSDRRFVIYVFRALGGGSYNFIVGTRAPGDARPVYVDASLTAGTTYLIGVDHDAGSHDNFDFTLLVGTLPATAPDTCASAITLSSTLPAVALANINGAAADYTFTQSSAQCAVANTTTAAGPDHVYYFSPAADGQYAIELASDTFDGVLYIDDSCGPFFGDGCLGASNNATGGTSSARHDLVVVNLEAGKDYYIYVDDASTTAITGPYALIVDSAYAYEVSEVEPNDTPGTATPVTTPLNGGQLVGPADEDWFAVTGNTGDRVYAWVNNGGSTNSTLDTELRFYAADGSTLIEYDDDDGEGGDSTIEDLRYIYATSSAAIAGAAFTSDGTHYLRVTDKSATGTVSRYRLHVGVEPADRTPMPEVEPNNTIATANQSVKQYYSGVIDATTDLDVFAFQATAGDRVFIAEDGDPERDGTGNTPPNTDPRAFHAKLVVYDPAGDTLITVADSNAIQTATPDYPAQAFFFVARTTGTYYVQVGPQSSSSQVGPTETYYLAIFLNDAAPVLTDVTDPVLTLTPDYLNDVVHGTATDNAAGDSGVCNVALAGATNLQITNLGALPAASVTFDVALVNPAQSGFGQVVVTDCVGNTTAQASRIDVVAPVCSGYNFSKRTPFSLHNPIHAPDNNLTGINGTISVADSGTIIDVNVTVTIEAINSNDVDCWLESPTGTRVELFTDRGSSSGWDITNATFDDSATEMLPMLSSSAPYTGTWKPEDAAGLAKLIGENAQGVWKLNVVDDSSIATGGSRLVRWSLDITAGFTGPQSFAGSATDQQSFDAGIASVVLNSPVNTQLTVAPGFVPGNPTVSYTVSLVDPSQNGSGTVVVTDVQNNTCSSVIALNGLPDVTGPANSGAVSTDLTFKKEVLTMVPTDDPAGIVSSVNVPDSLLVGEVETTIMVDTAEVGQITSTLSHGGQFASLVNRVGNTERYGMGLTKDNIEITLDDDAPVADDAHLEPALGTIEFYGLHQPDGRGDYLLNGVSDDPRDNMLFRLADVSSAGQWSLYVADVRPGYAATRKTAFRRWAMTIKNSCGPQRYVGRAVDLAPGSGICTIAPGAGSSNLTVVASFTAGDQVVDYRVELTDPSLAGIGTIEITDCNSNVTIVPIALSAASADANPPVVGGAVNQAAFTFEGTATDVQAGDTGIAAVSLAPFSTNLVINSVTPAPPAGSVAFVIGLVNPAANGRGYVQVADGCGLRSYVLVEIDAVAPHFNGFVGQTRRYVNLPGLPAAIPDNNVAGVVSDVVVTDTDIISDVNLTFNITHPFDADIDMTLLTPTMIALFTDVGSTGNDFFNTTLDDEAAMEIPQTATLAPFDGSFRPESPATLTPLDGVPAVGTYSLRVADDNVNYTGTFDSWWLTITSSTFPQRFAGEARDDETLHSGVQSIALVDACNVTLVADSFTPGQKLVIFEVNLIDTGRCGRGTVRVTDVAGNVSDQVVMLNGNCGPGDTNHDGGATIADIIPSFVDALLNATDDCAADVNTDGFVDGLDVQAMVDLLL
jgi:subtilisin-like proprotein convertase family protein